MKLKTFLPIVPELYLIIATIYYWFSTVNLLNPLAIGLLALLVYLMVFKRRVLGVVIAGIFIFLNFYLVLAWLSELSEFTEPNDNFYNLFWFGALFLGVNLIMGVFMLMVYLKKSVKTISI